MTPGDAGERPTRERHTYERAARLRRAYQDGKDDFRNGLPDSENPYRDEPAAQWLEGYTDASEGL